MEEKRLAEITQVFSGLNYFDPDFFVYGVLEHDRGNLASEKSGLVSKTISDHDLAARQQIPSKIGHLDFEVDRRVVGDTSHCSHVSHKADIEFVNARLKMQYRGCSMKAV